MEIKYDHSEVAWSEFRIFLERLILQSKAKRICEVGGGANPVLGLDFILENDLQYTVIDISSEELDKAPSNYHKIQADMAAEDFSLSGEFDLIFSKMLAEHVKDGKAFHKNIRKLLAINGLALHFFPTLFALPFVANRLIPEIITTKLLRILQSGRSKSGRKGKFPAYYHWCRGPIQSQIKKFENLGYVVDKYIGFYGHGEYYRKVPFIKNMHDVLCKNLIKYPIPVLTSFAYVVLKNKQ